MICWRNQNKKTEHPYVEPQVQDAQTIETETHAVNDEFSQIKQEFDTVNDVATEQSRPFDEKTNSYNYFRNSIKFKISRTT